MCATSAASTTSASTSCCGEDDPLYANWDQDAAAAEDDYNGQDPPTVAAELRTAALGLAGAFDAGRRGAVAAHGPAQ